MTQQRSVPELHGASPVAEDAGDLRSAALQARQAARALALSSGEQRAAMLVAIADGLDSSRAEILAANSADCKRAAASGMAAALLDRLTLTESRFAAMVHGVRVVAGLPDPLGEVLEDRVQPNGLRIRKVRVPLGVIAMIYESRPNVTIDSAALCLRSGNAVMLRGGSEARETNAALVRAAIDAGRRAGLPLGALWIDLSGDRDRVRQLVQLEGVVDLAIPRGGEGLIRAVVESARVPVIKHYKGVCHLFVDSSAKLDQAVQVVVNAKCQRPGVCNALETLLVDRAIAGEFLPAVCEALRSRGVELRGDAETQNVVPGVLPAADEDWSAEYLDLILAIRVVDGLDAAIEHIEQYGSRHSDGILTEDSVRAAQFLAAVDSAVVYHNASTRFTDGSEFGLGAEIGISTDKLHARGPMGLKELTSYKYTVCGAGHIRG